jgi:hypothetical protein
VVWECKTAREFRPLEWCRQAARHPRLRNEALSNPSITVYFPNGMGEQSTGSAIAMMPLDGMVKLLCEAGYGVDKYEGVS